MKNYLHLFLIVMFFSFTASSQNIISVNYKTVTAADVKVGAQRTAQYFPLLKGKNIAVVANQTSMIGKTHLVDSLKKSGVNVKKVFVPEHGFRGVADAGQEITNTTDSKTGLPIISLYGKDYKPKPTDLKGIDVLLFDLQDVGVRCYTYISTLHYVMEACAENKVQCIVLDRPNPNGFFIDGPILENEFTSFVGMHPVPFVYGMTIAEYACMINEEGWLKKGIKCDLKYVTVENYNHTYYYELPVKPSPNLIDMNSVYLYPSLAMFEGTVISVGRGTDLPFQVIGHPLLKSGSYTFVPKSMPGATTPLFEGKECKGYNLSNFAEVYVKNIKQIYLFWLMGCYQNMDDKANFFNAMFDKIAGTAKLKQQIVSGVSEEDIRKSWKPGLDKFKLIRKKYLLYPDFE